jgi:serine/threonine protein kinase/peptidoglycan hydrolase-like protein with peptidoglycan-binding domain
MKVTAGDSDSVGAQFDHVTLRPGQHVGRYRIVSVLGQGGFGVTYRAVDSELGRDVAIKEYLPAALAIRQDGKTVMPRSTGAAEDFAWGRDRFVAEGRTLAALQRAPGIVLVHDFLEANGTAYLVMELVAGRTLHEQVAQYGPLDAAALDGIVWRLLDGLAAVHAAGFLHRDIKPANILLDAEGHATLIDFGASRVAGRSQTMTAVFTPGYGAVEQFTAAPQGPWTDIYGLAATLHFAITGQPPPNAIDRILDDTLAPLAAGKWPFPPALLAGIDAGLAVRADRRPQSIAEWRTLLSTAAPITAPGRPAVAAAPSTVIMSPAIPSAAPPPPVAPRNRPLLIAASVAVAVVGVAATGWFVLSSQPPSTPTPLASTQSASARPPAAVPPATQDQTQVLLDEARRAQQAALDEAARLRSEAEARRKADEEIVMRRQIEEEVRQKTAAVAEARRQAAEEAQRKAEAEAAERLKAEEADRAGAEVAEAALRLGTVDRQRIQVALTAMGYVTTGTDGVFGPRTREMIAAWQKNVGRAVTGYLTADAQAALLRDARPAVARWDEEQRAAATAARPAAPPPAKAGASCDGTFTARWCRGAYEGFPPSCWNSGATIVNGAISGSWTSSASGHRQSFDGRIDASGGVQITYNGIGAQTHVNRPFVALMTGTVRDRVLKATGRAGSAGREFTITIQCP